MSDNKKYYYLKLVDNFYDRDEMIMLESMPDGYMYSNILLKLYLRSLKNEGKLMFNNRIPYNATMLANVTRFPIAVVEKSISLFKELGLIEVLDNGAIYMLDIQNFIGKSSSEADRKRNYRKQIEEEKKLLKGGGQMSLNCPAKTPPEIEIEIEIEKEIDINKHKEKPVGDCVGKNLSLISKMYKENIGPIYPANRDWIIEVSETIDADLFKRAIEICIDRSSVSPGYLKGIIKKWTAEKIITLDDLKVKEMEYQNKKANNKSKTNKKEKIDTITEDEELDPEQLAEMKRLEEALGIN